MLEQGYKMTVKTLDIFSYFNKQRFVQAGSRDCANWYNVDIPDSKNNRALYPAMGRQHIEFLNNLQLLFTDVPRFIFKSINFFYVVVDTQIIQVDKFYNQIVLPLPVSLTGDMYFAFLPVITTVYCMLTDGTNVFVITESQTAAVTMQQSTTDTPMNPMFVVAFGNRFVVSSANTPTFTLSQINLGGVPIASADSWFTIPNGMSPGYQLFAQATGIIGQIGVLNNQMYIFSDFDVDIWSNIPVNITVAQQTVQFPFKLSTAYQWNVGIAEPHSLAIDFGFMVWLAKNRSGLVTFMMSDGRSPQSISTQAVNVLLESKIKNNSLSPFLQGVTTGFLYMWENSIFYRAVAGKIINFGKIRIPDSSDAIEYNFNSKKWHRTIEVDGTRNLISQHIYFNAQHIVIVDTQTNLYEMRGDLYTNEIQNFKTPTTPPTFIVQPFRYELVTTQIWEADYSEFITDYVEIDFVFGDMTFYKSQAPFLNTVYIVDENVGTDGKPIFMITENSTPSNNTFIIQEGTNFPTPADNHYYELFNPHIELYYSDNGGIIFHSADLREFSPLGIYSWRMRWYQLGPSRNRVYKLVAVSAAPIVILSAVHNIRRASGGEN